MKRNQLADRIGNIDERLVKATETYQKKKSMGGKILRKGLAAAAVFVLMVSSATVGALAFSRETVVEVEKVVEVPVEKIVEVAVERVVEVPVGQETLTLEDIGITLILPDSWKGKYALGRFEDGGYYVYNPDIQAALSEEIGHYAEGGGMLFYIVLWHEQLTREQAEDPYSETNFAHNEYIMTTSKGTYLLYHASDVRFTQDTVDEYRQMESEIKDIRFVIDNALSD